jgi:hypothetical protein
MPITILPPAPPPSNSFDSRFKDGESSDEESDLEGDIDMEGANRGSKRLRISRKHIVTPGELVTDDAQWMRYNFLRTLSANNFLTIYIQRTWNLPSPRLHRNPQLRLRHYPKNEQTPLRHPNSRSIYTRDR